MSKRDIRQEITNKIIRQLETVKLEDLEPPFAALAAQGLPCNAATGDAYRGINIPSLWIEQQERSFSSNQWATFKQWKQSGAQVRKGEKGCPIIFYATWNKQEDGENGESEERTIPVLRHYTVFNADQVDGYAPTDDSKALIDLVTRIAAVDAYCSKIKADIREGGVKAFYRASDDFIAMPSTHFFVETRSASATENYYSVLLHELTHWTGAKHRLDRDKARHRGELVKYAFEELVAELGSAFLCAKFGIGQTARDCHAQYLKSWLAALKNDPTHIFKAAAEAGKAMDYLDSLQS